MRLLITLVCLLLGSVSLSQKVKLMDVLADLTEFQAVIKDYEKYRFECILTQFEHHPDGTQEFFQQDFGNPRSYYYPASTIKFPLALAATQMMGERDWRAKFHFGQFPILCKKYMYEDIYEPHELIRKMLVYSDNPAYNQLFEYVGPTRISNLFKGVGLPGFVTRRLLICSKKYWKKTLPVYDAQDESNNLKSVKHQVQFKNKKKDAKIGTAHYYGGEFYEKPRDFSKHNYLPLSTVHRLMSGLIYNFGSLKLRDGGPGISKADRDSLIRFMGVTPREIGDSTKEDGITKYIYMGNSKDPIPDNIRIINIVGQAYGFLTDHAYVADLNTGAEYILSVRIYVNENNVLGDDKYEYDTIAFPLFEKLGKEILKRINETGGSNPDHLKWLSKTFSGY